MSACAAHAWRSPLLSTRPLCLSTSAAASSAINSSKLIGFDSGDNPSENPPAGSVKNASARGRDSVSVERCAVYPTEITGNPTGSIIEIGAPSFEVKTIDAAAPNCAMSAGL